MYIAHGPISFLANEVIQKKNIKKLKMNEQILVALCSLFFGILPDFDILLLSIFNAPRFIHHDIITHSPILYIGIWLVMKLGISFAGYIFNKKTSNVLDKRLLNILANTFIIATLFHLLADLLVNSIMVLYPLTNFRFFILKFIFEPSIFTSLPFSTFFAIEVLFISIFLFVIYKKFFKESKFFAIFLQSLIAISVIYLPFTMYMTLNTYGSSFMYDEKGNINFDIDYDRVSDKLDMDVGNTGESNILKANDTDVLDGVLGVINSNKWTGNHSSSFIASIKYVYGGIDSYRLVTQAYYDIRLPIGPVLRDYHIKRYGFDSYFSSNYDYPSLLLDFLKENDQLIELNLESDVNIAPGKIFFVMTEDEEILNLGITLEGNYLAIVLGEDERLTMHSYRYIREYYGDSIGKINIQN